MKNNLMFLIILLYILIGCEETKECNTTYLELNAPNLIYDNSYYELKILDGYIQTFTTLEAYTESITEYQKVGWLSNKEININGTWINLVNQSSYTNEEGVAYTILGVYKEFVGDTITIYCTYDNTCNSEYFIDSLKIIIK